MPNITIVIYDFSGGAPPYRGFFKSNTIQANVEPNELDIFSKAGIPSSQCGSIMRVSNPASRWNELTSAGPLEALQDGDTVCVQKTLPLGMCD